MNFFLFNLILFHDGELNAIMSNCGVNLFNLNMLVIKIDVRFPKPLVRPNYLTLLPTSMFSQPIKFRDK